MALAKRARERMNQRRAEQGLPPRPYRPRPAGVRAIKGSEFVVCLTSGIVHRKSCYYGQRARRRRDYESPMEAVEDGYRGCKWCKPRY